MTVLLGYTANDTERHLRTPRCCCVAAMTQHVGSVQVARSGRVQRVAAWRWTLSDRCSPNECHSCSSRSCADKQTDGTQMHRAHAVLSDVIYQETRSLASAQSDIERWRRARNMWNSQPTQRMRTSRRSSMSFIFKAHYDVAYRMRKLLCVFFTRKLCRYVMMQLWELAIIFWKLFALIRWISSGGKGNRNNAIDDSDIT